MLALTKEVTGVRRAGIAVVAVLGRMQTSPVWIATVIGAQVEVVAVAAKMDAEPCGNADAVVRRAGIQIITVR